MYNLKTCQPSKCVCSPGSPPPLQQKRYGRSLLDEARQVNEGLRQQILVLQEQIARNEDENAALKNKLDATSKDTCKLSLKTFPIIACSRAKGFT